MFKKTTLSHPTKRAKDERKRDIELSSSSSSGRKEQLMHAIVAMTEGGPEVLKVQLVPRPVPKANEVLVSVSYVGVNRPDIEERKFGKQPSITDLEKDGIKSKYLGLECSGTISAHGDGLSKKDKQAWEIGKKVCCIVFGGAYAEYVAVPIGHLLRFSSSKISLQQAAAIPQAACTVWAELFMKTRVDETNVREKEGSRLSPGETILIHGGCSGIGIFSIQMAKYYEATVFATAGTEEKVEECKRLGADICMNYTKIDFAEEIMKMTKRQGVDVILDCVGLDYRERNLECLKKGGRLVQIGGCWMTCFDSYQPIQPHFSNLKCIVAASLVYRTPEMKAAIVKEVQENVMPLIEDGHVKIVTYNRKVFTFKEAAQAHELKEGNHIGKVLLKPGNLP